MEQASLVNSRKDPDIVYARGGLGLPGKGLQINGTIATYTDLSTPHTGKIGDVIVTLDDKHIHFWNGTDWKDLGTLQGDKGDTGDSGISFSLQGKDTLTNILLKVGQPGDIWSSTTSGVDSYGDTVLAEDILAWAETTNSWVTLGQLMGPEGLPGIIGPEGLPGNDGVDIVRKYAEFHAAAGQTTFPLDYDPATDAVIVYRIGIRLPPEDYTATSGTEVVLHAPVTALEDILLIVENIV